LSPVPIFPRLNHLIPLECSGKSHLPKIVIGHNIGYDRAKVREQYVLQVCSFKLIALMPNLGFGNSFLGYNVNEHRGG
jgi:hypothetical protein